MQAPKDHVQGLRWPIKSSLQGSVTQWPLYHSFPPLVAHFCLSLAWDVFPVIMDIFKQNTFFPKAQPTARSLCGWKNTRKEGARILGHFPFLTWPPSHPRWGSLPHRQAKWCVRFLQVFHKSLWGWGWGWGVVLWALQKQTIHEIFVEKSTDRGPITQKSLPVL